MTILSPQILLHVIELAEAGASIAETTTAIGASKNSKIIFKWIADSAEAGEFGARPDPNSPWCITRGDRCEWFHILLQEARATARAERAATIPPIRADLEARLRAKRSERPADARPTPTEQQLPARTIVELAIERTALADVQPPPPPPKTIPPYAYRSGKPLDTVNADGPPFDGRFTVAADRPKSQEQRRRVGVEITDLGVRRW